VHLQQHGGVCQLASLTVAGRGAFIDHNTAAAVTRARLSAAAAL